MSNGRSETAIVVGASRGFGRGVAIALAEAGAKVIAVARDEDALATIAGDRIVALPGDATDPTLASDVLSAHDPGLVVVVAGARPHLAPIHEQTWDSFSANWHADVRITFEFVKAALRQPLRPGSRVITFSSGAALSGSPMSGGYAGANATVRFITQYAAAEAEQRGLGIEFTALLPKLSHETGLGREAVIAYAEQAGVDLEEHMAAMGPVVTPAIAGRAIVELAASDHPAPEALLLTADGLVPPPH